jgi:protein involved in ribonucleotide reduction
LDFYLFTDDWWLAVEIVYFSNYSGNTKKFVEKLGYENKRIPIQWEENCLVVENPYVLVVPTYGGGSESHSVPRQVIKFLNVLSNRQNILGVVGMGNTNFGENFCRAAEIISQKTNVPLVYKVEITGTSEDVIEVKKRMEMLCKSTVTTN